MSPANVHLFKIVFPFQTKPIDNESSHLVLPPGHWILKLQSCWLFHANVCKIDAEIKSYKDGKTIWIYHNHYLPCTYNSERCRYVCNCYYYDRAVHIPVAVDMRTLLDRNNCCSSSNGQVAARRVTWLIIKRLCFNGASRRCGIWQLHLMDKTKSAGRGRLPTGRPRPIRIERWIHWRWLYSWRPRAWRAVRFGRK